MLLIIAGITVAATTDDPPCRFSVDKSPLLETLEEGAEGGSTVPLVLPLNWLFEIAALFTVV